MTSYLRIHSSHHRPHWGKNEKPLHSPVSSLADSSQSNSPQRPPLEEEDQDGPGQALFVSPPVLQGGRRVHGVLTGGAGEETTYDFPYFNFYFIAKWPLLSRTIIKVLSGEICVVAQTWTDKCVLKQFLPSKNLQGLPHEEHREKVNLCHDFP